MNTRQHNSKHLRRTSSATLLGWCGHTSPNTGPGMLGQARRCVGIGLYAEPVESLAGKGFTGLLFMLVPSSRPRA